MLESDHSDHGEGEDTMSPLKLSPDPLEKANNKRLRDEHSDNETQDLSKKKLKFSNEILEESNTEVNSHQNGIEEHNKTKEVLLDNKQIENEEILPNSSAHKENQEDKLEKQDNKNDSQLHKISPINDENEEKIEIEKQETKKEDDSSEESDINTDTNKMSTSEDMPTKVEKENEKFEKEDSNETANTKEINKENGVKRSITKNHIVDLEVVDGLELSVECASDRESSSESEDEKDAKPRPKTIIVKAVPNESELECYSSEGEKSSSQEATDVVDSKSEKKERRKRSRTSLNKLKIESESEDSKNNNSDEDYSPRTKKKMKKSQMMKKSGKRVTEPRKGRANAKKHSQKKDIEHISDAENENANIAEKSNTTKDNAEEELTDKESLISKSEGNSNSEDEEKHIKSGKGRRSNAKPEDNKQIQQLKKYLNVAGVKIRSYKDIWADCKTNTARVKRLKELLEKNGITGRPTLEKCKRVKEKNEKLREVSELDTSNIISEGRITRARRGKDNKNAMSPDTSRHREGRNTYKRIQTVVDSDSE